MNDSDFLSRVLEFKEGSASISEDDKYLIRFYKDKDKDKWNQFIPQSKNGTFLFDRNYMDYHSERFHDCSLMIFKKDKLQALLPANFIGKTFYSHQGLTYGGLIINSKLVLEDIIEIFQLLNDGLRELGFTRVIYKPTPYIYHKLPSDEDIYALFKVCGAKMIGCNISSTILQKNKLKFTESRKSGIRKAKSKNIEILKSNDFRPFWRILTDNLNTKYGVAPVHSLEEIELLHMRFPQNIILYEALLDNEVIGGTLLYITDTVVHTQYISASAVGKEFGALDLLFDKLINQEFDNYQWFDFGQSTENFGNILNEQLLFQKEGFGGRGVCYEIYEYCPENDLLELDTFNEETFMLSQKWLDDDYISYMICAPKLSINDRRIWFDTLSDNENYKCWTVLYHNRPIGVCGLKNISRDKITRAEYFGYIGEKKYRERGLGTRMMKKFLLKAKDLNITQIDLKVKHDNLPAISLYKKIGFKEECVDINFIYMYYSL